MVQNGRGVWPLLFPNDERNLVQRWWKVIMILTAFLFIDI